MATVVEQRQEAPVEPGERADAQHDGEQQEGSSAERLHRQGGCVDLQGDGGKAGADGLVASEIQHDRGDQDGAVEQLEADSPDRQVLVAHGGARRFGATSPGPYAWRTNSTQQLQQPMAKQGQSVAIAAQCG